MLEVDFVSEGEARAKSARSEAEASIWNDRPRGVRVLKAWRAWISRRKRPSNAALGAGLDWALL
jgi:hypothetical protein